MATERPAPHAPPMASRRGILRSGLPEVLRGAAGPDAEESFGMRFVEGLEEVLDPILAILDQLPAHLDLDVAPPPVVDLAGSWLGLDPYGDLPLDVRRALVARAFRLGRARGTVNGIRDVLTGAFPGAGVTVRDSGGVTASLDPDATERAGEAAIVVTCPPTLSAQTRAAVRRVAAELRPVGVTLTVEVADEGGRAP